MTTGASNESTLTHYNRLAAAYNENWSYSEDFVAWMRIALYERLVPAEGERAMDLGCGTGLYTGALVPTERPITVVDPSPAMLAQVLARAGEGRVLPLCATAQDVASGQQSVPESAYDAILAKEVLHHVPASQRAGIIAGLSRLLAPGGRLLVAMLPTRIDYPLWPEALELFTSLQPNPDDIAQAMTAAGLTVEVSHATYRLSFTRNRYLSMVRSRYMSLLSHFDDAEIENGITQLLHKHGDTPQFVFQDRFALILGRAGSRAEAAGHV